MSGVQQKTNQPEVGQPYRPAEVLSGTSELLARALRAGLPQGVALTLWALGSRIGNNGHCWPSVQRLAQDINLSERSVRRYVRELETLGLVRTESRGNGRSLAFFLLWQPLLEDGHHVPPKRHSKAPAVRPPSATQTPHPGQPDRQNHLHRTSKESTSSPASPATPKAALTPQPQTPKAISHSMDDETRWPNPTDSPEQQLVALYQRKTHAPMPAVLFREIRETLELRNIPLPLYLAELRSHAANHWDNPGGFLLWFARRFSERTVPALLAPPTQPPLGAGKALPCGCGGGGYLSAEPLVFCACAMGKEVERVHRRQLPSSSAHVPAGVISPPDLRSETVAEKRAQ